MDISISHLLEASIKLGCTVETKARALILYHHFMRCVDEVHYDANELNFGDWHKTLSLLQCFIENYKMVAAVALGLSGRIHEQVIDIDSLLCVFYSVVSKTTEVLSPDDVAFVLLKKSLISIDFLMQRMLEFNLNHRLAHQYLVPFLAFIFERCKNISEFRNELSNSCIRILSDFYTTRNCLNYQPEHIAIACIDLSLYMHGMVNDVVLIPVWYQGFCNDLTAEKVREIKGDMMILYYDSAPIPKKKVLQKK